MSDKLMTPRELAKMIDQTLLQPYVSNQDLKRHCEEAAEYGFKTVAVNNAAIPFCCTQLKESDVLVDGAVSFPLGQCTIETKVFETLDAISKGAAEIDYVVNLTEVKNNNWDYVKREMYSVVEVCQKKNIVSKVIFENCYLTEAEKRKLCAVALEVAPSFIKTSTGFGIGGAVIEDVRLMKECVGDAIGIKAAGGIRSAKEALTMIRAGAGRLGTSKGCEIIDEYKEMSILEV